MSCPGNLAADGGKAPDASPLGREEPRQQPADLDARSSASAKRARGPATSPAASMSPWMTRVIALKAAKGALTRASASPVRRGAPPRLRSVGSYGWDGAAGACFFADPAEELLGVCLTQVLAHGEMPGNTYQEDFQRLVYQALA